MYFVAIFNLGNGITRKIWHIDKQKKPWNKLNTDTSYANEKLFLMR